MKKMMHIMLVGLLGILMVGSSLITPATAPVSHHPPGAINPRGPMKAAILRELLRYIPQMENANFTGTNVLYTTFSATDTFEHTIDVDNTISAEISDLSSLKTGISDLSTKLLNMNSTLTNLLDGQGNDYWTTMDQSLVENDYYTFTFSFLAYVYVRPENLQSLSDFEGWLEITVFEGRLYRLIWHLSLEVRLNLFAICRAFEVDDPVALVDIILPVLTTLEAELNGHTSLTITRHDLIDLDVTSTIDDHAVVIFWDHDGSVVNVLDDLKNNETTGSQPFSGDEVLHITYMTDESRTISGSIEIENTWEYEDESSAHTLYDYLKLLFNERTAGLGLGNIPVHRFTYFLGPRSEVYDGTYVEREARFGIAQLRINELMLRRTPQGHLYVSSSDFDFIEHHSLGNIIYNDTNGDGHLTLKMEKSPEGVAYQANGSEALYRFRVVDFGDKTYQAPNTADNELNFGFDFSNVEGRLFPVDIDEDRSGFNSSYAPIAEKIDQLAGLFHFTVDPMTGESHLKFDYILGNWNDTEPLEGLSFAHLMGSNFIKRSTERSVDEVVSDDDQEVDDSTIETKRISRFRYRYGGRLVADIRLDDIPYEWNGTQQNAIGMLIPLRFAEMSFGRSSSNGAIITNMRGQVERRTYLYAISYPKWDGLAISHDPDYMVTSGVITSPSSSSEDSGKIAGFELGLGLIGMVVLITMRKRKE